MIITWEWWVRWRSRWGWAGSWLDWARCSTCRWGSRRCAWWPPGWRAAAARRAVAGCVPRSQGLSPLIGPSPASTITRTPIPTIELASCIFGKSLDQKIFFSLLYFLKKKSICWRKKRYLLNSIPDFTEFKPVYNLLELFSQIV